MDKSKRTHDASVLIVALRAKRTGCVSTTLPPSNVTGSSCKAKHMGKRPRRATPPREKPISRSASPPRRGKSPLSVVDDLKCFLSPLSETFHGTSLFDKPPSFEVDCSSGGTSFQPFLEASSKVLLDQVIESSSFLSGRQVLDLSLTHALMGSHLLIQHYKQLRTAIDDADEWKMEKSLRDQLEREAQQLREQQTKELKDSVQVARAAQANAEDKLKEMDKQLHELKEEMKMLVRVNTEKDEKIAYLDQEVSDMVTFTVDSYKKVLKEMYPEVDFEAVTQRLLADLRVAPLVDISDYDSLVHSIEGHGD